LEIVFNTGERVTVIFSQGPRISLQAGKKHLKVILFMIDTPNKLAQSKITQEGRIDFMVWTLKELSRYLES